MPLLGLRPSPRIFAYNFHKLGCKEIKVTASDSNIPYFCPRSHPATEILPSGQLSVSAYDINYSCKRVYTCNVMFNNLSVNIFSSNSHRISP